MDEAIELARKRVICERDAMGTKVGIGGLDDRMEPFDIE
jgi:hypothetical protein